MSQPDITHNADQHAPINQYQRDTNRKIAQHKIEAALEEFARQLPQGLLYLQEAINAAGAILDNLERQTGQYNEATEMMPSPSANEDLAGDRAALAGVEESDTFKGFDQS